MTHKVVDKRLVDSLELQLPKQFLLVSASVIQPRLDKTLVFAITQMVERVSRLTR